MLIRSSTCLHVDKVVHMPSSFHQQSLNLSKSISHPMRKMLADNIWVLFIFVTLKWWCCKIWVMVMRRAASLFNDSLRNWPSTAYIPRESPTRVHDHLADETYWMYDVMNFIFCVWTTILNVCCYEFYFYLFCLNHTMRVYRIAQENRSILYFYLVCNESGKRVRDTILTLDTLT